MTKSNSIDSAASLCEMSATSLARAIRSRDVSPVEICEAVFDRIDRLDPHVNSFITVVHEQARKEARAAEQAVMTEPAESLPLLHGIPVSVKDLTPTRGVKTSMGLPQFADHVPDEDGLTWARLKAQGAILTGKTSTPPQGALCVTENDIVGRTNNPWDLNRTVGGSSGGAAAALAAGFGPLATASDGGGSIRVPGSYCGVVGLKASRGRIPLYTEGPVFETVDVVGPMARTVEDAALMLSIMSGPHPHDPYSLLDNHDDFHLGLSEASVQGMKIACSFEMGRGLIENDVHAGISAALGHFQSNLGAEVDLVEMDMPDIGDYFMTYWGPSFSLFMDDPQFDFTRYPPLQYWLEKGKQVSAVDHLRCALITRETLHTAFANVFDTHDLLITPTTPQTAFPHPDPNLLGPSHVAGVPVSLPAIDFSRFTDPPSNAGYPALTMPCGLSPEGLPIGMQIIGKHGADAQVLRAAAAFENSIGPIRPSLSWSEGTL